MSNWTLKQVAGHYRLSVSDIKVFLREHFATPGRTFSGGDCDINHEEFNAIHQAFETGELGSRRRRVQDVEDLPVADAGRPISSADLDPLAPVSVRSQDGQPRPRAGHPVFMHVEVLDDLERPDTPKPIKKNLTRRIQELMAHGRANKTKGVKGTNAGYLRIPLGGTSGQQYYLWLVNRGERIRQQDTAEFYAEFPENARILRAVRHHDDTDNPRVLSLGAAKEYLAVEPENVMLRPEADGLAMPLTDSQLKIVAGGPIRFIQGQPGAGKTSSLHEATRRLSGRMLYLTWSRALAEHAREWLSVYAPEGLDVEVWTFLDLVTRVDPQTSPRPRPPRSERIATLTQLLGPHRARLGAWSQGNDLHTDELYAELHAHLFGAALPVDFRGRPACRGAFMPGKDGYLQAREPTLGAAAAQAYEVCGKLSPAEVGSLFPELDDAFARAHALLEGRLVLAPELFAFDWVLVDEIQDLTLLEQWLVLDVAARAGVTRGVRPGLIVAGDEAQTVRATGFEWGPLHDLVRARFGERDKIESHELTTNLRAPHDLASFINHIRHELYASIDKRQRPRGRQDEPHTEATVGRILQAQSGGPEGIEAVVRSFAGQGDAALVYTGDVVPAAWAEAAQRHNTVVWTSEQAKGLEFRVVAVLDVPETVTRIRWLADQAERSSQYAELARAAIDRFLVAVSRSNEVLVLLASQWGAETQAIDGLIRGAEAEGFLGLVDHEMLADLLSLDAADSHAQIDQLLQQSERLQDAGELEGARRLAQNALGLLGRAGRPGAAGDEQRRRVRRRHGLLVALQALASGERASLEEARKTLRAAKQEVAADVVLAVAKLGEEPTELAAQQNLAKVVDRLDDLQAKEPMLVIPVLERLATHLEGVVGRGHAPRTAKGREALTGALDWLASAAPTARDRFATARRGLLIAMLHDLADGGTEALIREFATLRTRIEGHPDLARLDARHAEAKGDHADATSRWRALGELEGAMRCARRLGDLRAVAEVAEALGAADLDRIRWGVELLELLERRPTRALHEDDANVLRRAVEAALPGGQAKGRGKRSS